MNETPPPPSGFIIEHILLSVTVVSTSEGAGQFDDSAANCVEKGLMEYHGVKVVDAEVAYRHTKIERHQEGCDCYFCQMPIIAEGHA